MINDVFMILGKLNEWKNNWNMSSDWKTGRRSRDRGGSRSYFNSHIQYIYSSYVYIAWAAYVLQINKWDFLCLTSKDFLLWPSHVIISDLNDKFWILLHINLLIDALPTWWLIEGFLWNIILLRMLVAEHFGNNWRADFLRPKQEKGNNYANMYGTYIEGFIRIISWKP